MMSSRTPGSAARAPPVSRDAGRVALKTALLLAVLLPASPRSGQAQRYEVPEVSAGWQVGVEELVDPGGRALWAGEVAARWDVGFELALGVDFSYRAREPVETCVLPLRNGREGCPTPEPLGPFEQLRFWTIHLEPRYRAEFPSVGLRPFLGGRAGPAWWTERLDEPGRSGVELAAVGGVEYRPTSDVGLEVSALYGTVSRGRAPGLGTETTWEERTSLRAGVRVHF